MIVGTGNASLAYHYNEDHILWLLVLLTPLWRTIILRIVLLLWLLVPLTHLWRTIILRIVFSAFWYRWLICDVPLYWGSYSLPFGTGDSSVTYHYIEYCILWLLVPVTPLWRTIILRIALYDCWYRCRLYYTDDRILWLLVPVTPLLRIIILRIVFSDFLYYTGDSSVTYHYSEDCILWLLVPVTPLWRTIILRIVFYDCWYRWLICDVPFIVRIVFYDCWFRWRLYDVPLYWGSYSMTVGTGDASVTYHYTEDCILWLLVPVTPLWRTIILRLVFYDCWYRWRLCDVPLYRGLYSMTVGTGDVPLYWPMSTTMNAYLRVLAYFKASITVSLKCILWQQTDFTWAIHRFLCIHVHKSLSISLSTDVDVLPCRPTVKPVMTNANLNRPDVQRKTTVTLVNYVVFKSVLLED